MPVKCNELWKALGREDALPGLDGFADLDLTGSEVDRQAVLFPKIES